MQGQIEVKISKSQTVDGQAPDVGQEREAGKPSVQNQALAGAAIALSKQVLSQGITQYGNLTGNYARVETINNVLGIVSDIGIIAAGGPVGAIAVATKYALNLGNSVVSQITANREIAFAQQRAGYIATQGSRYKQ